MSDLLLNRRRRHARLGRCLVLFNGSPADGRALETALELASYTCASLQGLLLEGEFRGYSVSVEELERLREARHRRFAGHAFGLCDRALEQGVRLPLELVSGDGHAWLRHWIDACGFELVVIAHEHSPFQEDLPMSAVARVRRRASCPVVVVK